MATKPQINLLPWDPDSPEHVERLYQQRVACGWNKERVEEWREHQRDGKIALYWVMLSESDPSTVSNLRTHTTAWPAESSELQDSSTKFGGKIRTANPGKTFIPVGHISLDSENEDPNEADSTRGIYRISSFYISTALQSAGLGRVTMDEIERLATAEPLNAKTLTLGTVANDYEGKKERWEALKAEKGMKPPFSKQDWYARRGYQVTFYIERFWTEIDSQGREWGLTKVNMRKDIK